MADADLDALAAKGRAARDADDQRKAELRAQFETAQTDEARKQAMWRLSPLAMHPLRLFIKLPYLVVWGTTLAMGFPYFIYFVTGKPVHGSSKGSGWVLDPAHDGYLLFYVFLVATVPLVAAIVWRRSAWAAGRRRFVEETAWAESVAIPLLGYPTALGGHDHRYKLDVYFKREPTKTRASNLADVLRGVDGVLKADGSDSSSCSFVADYPSDDAKPRNAQRFAVTLRAVMDVLVKLHAEFPIDRVEVRA